MFSNEIIFFASFTVFIISVLSLDLGIFSKKDHTVSFKEAAIWSAVWITFALIFYVILQKNGDIIHGIQNFQDLDRVVQEFDPTLKISPNSFENSLQAYRDNMALEFITGYVLEYSLSVDNIFVILMIFNSFGVRQKYYKKVLFWGILGAIVMRFIFIFVGSALIHAFHPILYGFGAFLIITGVKMFFDKDDEDKIDPSKHPIVRFASKNFKVYPRFVREHFFVKRHGFWFVTPLFLVVLIIEFTDLIFAVDSVPAVFSVTEDPYIVFFSNIFAILGLRSMFFFLSNVVHLFRFLKIGLSFLLIFIGFKMIFNNWLIEEFGFKTIHSLYIIVGILAVSIIASLIFPAKKENVNNALASVPTPAPKE